MIKHHLRSIDKDDGFGAYPRLVIEVEGVDDVYRLARHLELGQVEFCAIGVRVLRGLDRRWPGIVRALVARMGPHGSGYPGRRPRRALRGAWE